MITITKKHGKWSPGDRFQQTDGRFTIGIGKAEELVKLGVAEWDMGWGRFGYKDKRNKTKIENNGNSRKA